MSEPVCATAQDPTEWTFLERLRKNIDEPYDLYREFRENDPVHLVPGRAEAPEQQWFVFRHDDVARVLTGRQFGRRAAVAYRGQGTPPPLIPPGFPRLARSVENWLVFMDPPAHGRLRSLIADRFAERLRSGELDEAVRRITADLAGELEGRATVELVGAYAAPLPLLVVLEALGVDRADRAELRGHALALREGSSFRPGDRAARLARADEAAGRLDDYFRAAVLERRRTPRTDLIGELVAVGDGDGPLTDDALVGTCVHLLMSGHEATSNVVSKAALALLAAPAALAELRAGPQEVDGAVDELIRYDSPVQMVTRWAYRDTRVGGRAVRRGDKLTLVLGSANRDPARYPDPDELRIGRDVGRHFGFGMGIHHCLGYGLARLETGNAIRSMLEFLSSVDAADVRVKYADDIVFHGPEEIRLKVRQIAGAGL
ncbi:cytochrome P450 [Streptomyces sp. NPDC050658]|uniref:cytochrome P450 n=1 Tax=unclassified Streptomyces TaxID=2593676 RepID=UPI00343B5D5F